MEHLIDYDRYLNEVSKRICFYLINPINVAEEKEKFFSSETYNPQFEYEQYNDDITEIKEKLQENFFDTTLIGNVLNEKRKEYLKKIEMIKKVGSDEFTNFSVNVYGLPSERIIEKASQLLKLDPNYESQEAHLSVEQVRAYFEQAMKDYGFNWKIKEKKMVASAAVSPSLKTLYLREGTAFSYSFIKRLIVHEIGTHALRAENGWLHEFTIFRRGFPGYMGTEEGLAVMNEELAGVLNNMTLKVYGARTIAVHMAITKSFREIYQHLSQFFDEDTAWRTTVRAKRGISDTSKPGGLTKDYLYLDGYSKVKEYLEFGNDIKKLYIGKIGIDHLALVESMQLIPPKFLPIEVKI